MEIELGHNAIDMSVLMGLDHRYIRLPAANTMQILGNTNVKQFETKLQ